MANEPRTVCSKCPEGKAGLTAGECAPCPEKHVPDAAGAGCVCRAGYYDALRGGDGFESSTAATARRDALANSSVGVFVGVEPSGLPGADQATVFSSSGGALSVTSGRLSYSLGLVGPCYSIDTACASALAALHACVLALRIGDECDDGLAVGTKVLSEAANVATSTAGMTSARGRCHTFDLRADGYCRGEGCGAFLVRASSRGEAAVLGSAV